MKKYIMVVKDDVAGDFSFFGEFPSVVVGQRSFNMACKTSNNIPVPDLSLYVLCSFDTSTGAVSLNDDELGNFPSFVCRGEL